MAGFFITFEGIDGSGKTTQAQRLVQALSAYTEVCALREPGGTLISERIRDLLLDPELGEMSDTCELLLYEASRAQLVDQVIAPELCAGKVVICDRFFDSTYAYQAYGRGLDSAHVHTANQLAARTVVPDCTLVFDLDPQVAYARATQESTDRLEAAGLAFQERVRAGYLSLLDSSRERMHCIDAMGSEDEVFARLCDQLIAVCEGSSERDIQACAGYVREIRAGL